jgi:hypothetical protein
VDKFSGAAPQGDASEGGVQALAWGT